MFTICTDDMPGHALAEHRTTANVLADLDRIADGARAQLAANGEGGAGYVLCLTVRDSRTGEVMIRSAIAS